MFSVGVAGFNHRPLSAMVRSVFLVLKNNGVFIEYILVVIEKDTILWVLF